MTQKIFLENCYVKEIQAVIVSVENDKIELDKSIFYYQGGGQPADHGLMTREREEFEVVDVRKENGRIMHYVNRQGLRRGDKVICTLDWERRHVLMRYHTASHILTAIINQKTGALITGNQIYLDKTRFDFNMDNFERDKITEYVDEANIAIQRNMEIKTYFLPREEAMKIPGVVKLAGALPPQVRNLRIVEIGDIDKQADGGTHVANTSEIGKIEIIKMENKGKSNRRIYFKLV